MSKKTSSGKSADTRQRIARAALGTFADHGFDGASTREIARRAGVNQGLITYYFKSKEALWREAASAAFEEGREMIAAARASAENLSEKEAKRVWVAAFARFLAERPQLVRFMIGDGKRPAERIDWLVETHLKSMYASLEIFSSDPERQAHEFYALIGAAAVMFAVPDECERLTGIDPATDASIDLHVDVLTNLFCDIPTHA